jgi:hypothetical protein
MKRLMVACVGMVACVVMLAGSLVAVGQGPPPAELSQPEPAPQSPPQPPEQPAPAQPPAEQPVPPPAEQPMPEEPPMPEELEDDEPATVWLLEEREWDFGQVVSVYQPVRGVYMAETRSAVWMLELARDLFPGEAGLHSGMRETPFRLLLLDEDRTVVDVALAMKMTTVTGKQGDRVLLSVLLPENGDFDKVATIRVERRTQVGFPLTDILIDPAALSRPIAIPE